MESLRLYRERRSFPASLEHTQSLRVFYELRDSFRVILRLRGDGAVPLSYTAIEYFPYDIRRVVASDGLAYLYIFPAAASLSILRVKKGAGCVNPTSEAPARYFPCHKEPYAGIASHPTGPKSLRQIKILALAREIFFLLPSLEELPLLPLRI